MSRVTRSPAIRRILDKAPPRLGPFRLVAELGEGGFAPVFSAIEEHGGVELRTVAVKLFATAEIVSPVQVLEEARALCRVEHPNVVRFLQLVMDEGVLGIVMEHVRGRSVEARIEAEGTLSLSTTLEIGAAVATALACVHASGIVHRDVKPANVIDANGTYKLIDFGIAVRAPSVSGSTSGAGARPTSPSTSVRTGTDRTGESAVATGDTAHDAGGSAGDSADTIDEGSRAAAPAGTMGYIDPICLSTRQPADPSSDLYSLGALLYECLGGRLPASRGPGEQASQLHMPVALGLDRPPPLRSVAPNVPEEVARLVDSLVSPRREDRPRRAEWVASELERLRRTRPGERRLLPEGGPFRGLLPFAAEHRDVYFGRSVELATAIDVLRTRGVVALVGPSGSGKTSLARAAVVPAIVDGALGPWPSRWDAVAFSPGRDPWGALRRALAPVLGKASLPEEPEGAADALASRVDAAASGLVLLVDALEEMATIADPDRAALLARFVGAIGASPRSGVRLVVTLRRDFFDPLLAMPAWGATLTRGAVLVTPLGASVLLDALDERLAAYGYALESEAMRRELGAQLSAAAESMPLVEFALQRLWAERDDARRIVPAAALARIGGIAGALQQHAEDVLATLVRTYGREAEAAVRDLLVALTTPRGTRARRARSELPRIASDPRSAAVLDSLERARIVVVDEGLYTLGHEALLLEWPRLRHWMAETARDRATAEEVEQAAVRWNERRGTDLLLRGATLAAARAVARQKTVPLSDGAVRFVTASRRFEIRGVVGVVTLVTALAVGGLVFAGLYFRAERETEKEKKSAFAIARTLEKASNTPETERARAMAKLIAEKKQCEKEVDRLRSTCGPDAGP